VIQTRVLIVNDNLTEFVSTVN